MFDTRIGLIRYIENSTVLHGCIELLHELQENIKARGFDEDSDSELLKKLYGTNAHPARTLRDEYDVWSNTADVTEEECQTIMPVPVQENRNATPEECIANVLELVRTRSRNSMILTRPGSRLLPQKSHWIRFVAPFRVRRLQITC
jgi:hypothetical protein